MYTDKNCLSVPPEPLRAARAARGVRIENARLAVLEDLVVPRDTSILPVCSDVSEVPDGAQIYVSNSVGKTVVLSLDAIRAQPALVCALVPTLSLEEDISLEDLTDSVNAILEENMPVALSNFSRTPIVNEQFTLFVRKYIKDQAEATYYAIAEIKSVSDTSATFTVSRLVAEIAKTLTQKVQETIVETVTEVASDVTEIENKVEVVQNTVQELAESALKVAACTELPENPDPLVFYVVDTDEEGGNE